MVMGSENRVSGKKISLQLHNDDEIDFDELIPSAEDDIQSEEFNSSEPTQKFSTDNTPTPTNTPPKNGSPGSSSVITNGSRRESRGVSQEKVILEEPESEEEVVP